MIKNRLTAATADRFELYEESVQDTEADIQFVSRVFHKERKRAALMLREDFCGTAQMCADWVRTHAERTAVGLDLHAPTQKWGMRKHIKPLGDAAARVQLLCRNVLVGCQGSDVTVAFNFSWCALKTRAILLQYCQGVCNDLNPDGAFFLDIHGGTESFEEVQESRKYKNFTYVWDQAPYDTINGFTKRAIHFHFPDGSVLHRAFTYDWRLWTLPELQDVLLEAGFKRVDVYWEGDDGQGRGNGVFRRRKQADNEAAWVAYVVAWK